MELQTEKAKVQQVKHVPVVVAELRKLAAEDEKFNAICYVLAQRKRNRSTLTVRALKQALEKNGADFELKDYQKVIGTLGRLGIGKLETDKSGAIVGLSNIVVTLKSVGQAAAAKAAYLKSFDGTSIENTEAVAKKEEIASNVPFTLKLVVTIDGHEIPVPSVIKLNPKDLGRFLDDFRILTDKFKD